MTNVNIPVVTLQNKVKMPQLGFGVWQVPDGDDVERAVTQALATGYRSIDTAAVYGNELGVGQALAASGIPRADLFITSKVWNTEQGYETTLAAYEQSCARLGLKQLDLYLIHWAVTGKYKETWRAMEKLYREGRVRAIGVCNFQLHHLEDLLTDCTVVPHVNQIELHPLLAQLPLRDFCAQKQIQVEAWSPLMQGRLDLPLLLELAAFYGKTPAQIVLRWDIQHGLVTIPKSVTPARIKENFEIFDFSLSAEHMALLDGLNQNRRLGGNPDREKW